MAKQFYDAEALKAEWPGAVERHRGRIVNAATDEEFELAMLALLGDLNRSHVGFFHEGLSRSSSKMVLSATYMASQIRDGDYWTFQDVNVGGPAAVAGIRRGDVLLSVDGRPFRPPEHPMFAANSSVAIKVLTKGLQEETKFVHIPSATRKRGQLPQVVPSTIVTYKRLNNSVGYIRIAMYPGVVGSDVANDVSRAIQHLGDIRRLIIDLRGNTGGGIGVLRVMSLLTPDRVNVGKYSGGKLAPVNGAGGYHFVYDKVPANLQERLLLAARFTAISTGRLMVRRNTPVIIATEGLGPKPFHGRVVLLVDRHTASANEMLIAFAREHGLATIVGEATPGRVLSGEKFKLSHGYWLGLPIGAYQTKDGDSIEGQPIEPDVPAPFDPEAARSGVDTQLECAIGVVSAL